MWFLRIKCLLCFLLPCIVTGQSAGVPFVNSYSKSSYGYGTQNWDIEQGADGQIYFANNEGLLSFNGRSWQLFPLPNQTVLRSILISDGKIYAGGQNEFGYFTPDEKTKWRFHSLKNTIPLPHREFEDVWDLEILDEVIYFRSRQPFFNFCQCCFSDDNLIVSHQKNW